jgi:hypothetical protein
VAADLGFVADAAQGYPDELAAHGAGDGFAEGGLAHAGWTDQGQDRAGTASAHDAETAVGAAAADGQVLGDAFLDVVQAGVVGVEDGAGARDVVSVLGAFVPGHVEDGVEPGADPADLG